MPVSSSIERFNNRTHFPRATVRLNRHEAPGAQQVLCRSPGTAPDRLYEAIGKNGVASPWLQGCQGHKPMLICAFTPFEQGLQFRAGSWGCWEHSINPGQPLPSRSGPFPCLPFLPGTTQPPTSHREEEHQEETSWPPTRHRRSSICAILSNGWDERGPLPALDPTSASPGSCSLHS